MMRLYNEDKFSANFIQIPIRQEVYGKEKKLKVECFAVSIFDGHGGDECSLYLQDNFHKEIEECKGVMKKESFMDLFQQYFKKIGGYWRRVYKKREEYYDKLIEGNEKCNFGNQLNVKDDLYLRLTKSSLELDLRFLTNHNKSGSTSTSVLLYSLNPQDKQLYYEPNTISKLVVSHIGDTRAIICDKEGIARPLTSNHHPTSTVESHRLNKYTSGFMTDSFGENRFLNFANTRSFGDLSGKNRGISAEPEVTSYVIGDSALIAQANLNKFTINQGRGGDECFLVLVTDGVTNYATDQEITDLVVSTNTNKGEKFGSAQICAEEVCKYIGAVGGDDNATCLVIKLSNWGKWPAIDRTGKLREDKLNEGISRMERR
jgi:protein phosphatase PTC6